MINSNGKPPTATYCLPQRVLWSAQCVAHRTQNLHPDRTAHSHNMACKLFPKNLRNVIQSHIALRLQTSTSSKLMHCMTCASHYP